MEYIVRLLGFLLIPVIVNGVLALVRRQAGRDSEQRERKGEVVLPRFLALIGVVCGGLFATVSVLAAFFSEEIWVPIMFFAFALLASSLIVAHLNCRIRYDDEGFTHKSFFGIKRHYRYEELTGIREGTDVHLYVGKRTITIDSYASGGSKFISLALRKYREAHKRALPRVPRSGRDIFRGNVKEPAAFIFLYILLSLCLLALTVYITVFVFFSPASEQNTTFCEVTVASVSVREDIFAIEGTDGELYRLRFLDEEVDVPRLVDSITEGKTLSIYAEYLTPDRERAYFDIRAIKDGESVIHSFEEGNRLHTKEYIPLLYVVSATDLFLALYILLSIHIGRNAKRFSKRLVRMFFRDEQLTV